jgi:16S rRNA (cytidine1402-2'-O)-methyltransferase
MNKPKTSPQGKLVLVPNTLDFGCDPANVPSIEQALPHAVIEQAAQLTHWVAENAKTTRSFLKRVNEVVPLVQPLQSICIVELPRPPKGQAKPLPQDLKPLLSPALAGHNIGLMSEAGLPAVADPGSALVQTAHAAGVQVQVLCGPSALVLALAASGLHGQCFAFVGYLPVNDGERTAKLRELEALSKRQQQTQLLIETPYRNTALWTALTSQLQPSTRLSVSCGLTLPQGFSITRTVAQWRQQTLQLPNDTPAVFCFLADA